MIANIQCSCLLYYLLQGLGVSILTYNHRVKLGVLADVNLMKQPSVLVDLFAKHIYHLESRLHEQTHTSADSYNLDSA